MKKHLIYFVSMLIFSIILCGAASAANIPVNNITGIQNAINTAHDGDTLNLSAGTYKEHDITVNKSLTITGPNTGTNLPTAVVDAQDQGRVFKISSGVSVTLQYLLIQNGNATIDTDNVTGGGIYNNGTLIIKNCTIQKNTAPTILKPTSTPGVYVVCYGYGGGIYNSGHLTITDSNVNNNTAESFGGGIYNEGIMKLTNSNLYNNSVTGPYGGGSGGGISNGASIDLICSNGGTITLTNSNVYQNTATEDGAGIYNYKGAVTINRSNIFRNIATGSYGGGITNSGALNLSGSNVYQNTVGWAGGGISNDGIMCLTNSNIYQNTAEHYGAGIANFNGAILTATGSNVYNNTITDGYGGGIYNNGNATLTDSNIFLNTQKCDFRGGGGITNDYGGIVTLTGCSLYNNTANFGGGIATWEETVTLKYCRIFGNTAVTEGSAIYCGSGYVNATLNWWGSDSDPNSQVSGDVDVTPWLVYNPAPTVTVVDPANSAVNVLPNKVIQVTFSQPIKIGTGWIELKNSSGTIIPITTSINGYVLTITHTALLNGKYTLALHTGSLTNLAGNNINAYATSFTVDTPPTITSTDPANNAMNVPRNKVITVTFNEPIKAGNMWIELYNTVGTKTLIPITTSISGNVLTINHTALLATGTKYTLAFHTGSIRDLTGNSLAGVARYFTTSTDTTAPTITTTDPANNAVNVPRNKVITVTFSEPIKAGTMWIELYNTSGTKTPVPITMSISGNVLTINHAALLANGTKYTLAFHTGSITDNAGNPLASAARYFTTSTDATAPTITSTDPANNAVNVPRNKAITVTFNEPIKAGNMWIELYNTNGTKTPIPITTSISGNVLTINHAALLTPGTKYTLAFHTGSITDNAGNPLASTVRYFTTGSI